jgi:hypothetical protein
MRRKSLGKSTSAAAFTLAEVMIAVGVSAFLFAGILTASVSLQRCLSSTNDYSVARGNQQTAIDYISRDIRGAYTVTVSADTQTLTVTMPDYYSAYDAQGNPIGDALDPVINIGQSDYGTAAHPVIVSYYISGGAMMRQQWWWASGIQKTATLLVVSDVEDFQSSFVDLSSVVTFNITFAPKYSEMHGTTSALRQGTTITTSTAIRNTRRN